MSEAQAEWQRLFDQVASGEPAELRSQYLAVPGPGARGAGSAVPLLAQPWSPRPSGLIVPARTTGERVASLARRYLTAAEILPDPLPPSVVSTLIRGHRTEDVLACCAVLMAKLAEHPADRDVQQALVETFCYGDTKTFALAALGDLGSRAGRRLRAGGNRAGGTDPAVGAASDRGPDGIDHLGL